MNGDGLGKWQQLKDALKDPGFPIIAAVALFLMLTGVIPSPINTLIGKFDQLVQAFTDHERSSALSRESFRYLLFRLCLNTAQTREAERLCYGPPERGR